MPLQDQILNALKSKNIPVNVYLMSGIKLEGYIEGYDSFVIVLRNSSKPTVSMIYKHTISTILPQKEQLLKELLSSDGGKE